MTANESKQAERQAVPKPVDSPAELVERLELWCAMREPLPTVSYKSVRELLTSALHYARQHDQLRAELAVLRAVINDEFHKRGRVGPDAPDNSMVICPHCTSQFPAISVDDQTARSQLEAERDAAMRDARRYSVLRRAWVDREFSDDMCLAYCYAGGDIDKAIDTHLSALVGEGVRG